MRRGVAPIGTDGKSIELQHMLQSHDGPIAEVTSTFHKQNYAVLHINPNAIPSGIDRSDFTAWTRKYWKDRASGLASENPNC